jgi:AcrR family transcriptional regulator
MGKDTYRIFLQGSAQSIGRPEEVKPQHGDYVLVGRTKVSSAVREPTAARQKILNAAYELFARNGIQAVGVDAVVAHSGVAKMTLYRHFSSKEDLAMAFLNLRNERWAEEWLKAEVERRSTDPAERLLLIFDLYHEWFQRPDFEGCSFIRIMLETEPGSTLHQAAAQHLHRLSDYVTALANAAAITDAVGFGKTWQMLMEGSIVAACAGNRNAALDAKRAAVLLLKAWSV